MGFAAAFSFLALNCTSESGAGFTLEAGHPNQVGSGKRFPHDNSRLTQNGQPLGAVCHGSADAAARTAPSGSQLG